MSNFLNPLNPQNFGLNVTGNFHNLGSSGTFRLPNSDFLNKINEIDSRSRSSGNIGAIQLSGGQGNFIHDSNFEVSIDSVNNESSLTIGQTNTSKAYLLLNPGIQPVQPQDGAVKCFLTNPPDPLSQDIQCWINGGWATMTGTAGSSVAGSNTQVQYNAAGNFGADSNFTWVSGTQILTLGTPGINDGLILGVNPGTGSEIILSNGAGGIGTGLVGGLNPAITLNQSAGGNVTINGVGNATFTGINGFSVLIDADNAGGSLVKSQLFQTFDPIVTAGLQISSIIGGGGVNMITQILDNHTTQGFNFNYPLGPNGGMQLKANNIQFMQAGNGGTGSGFQFILDNDVLGLGDSVFRIVSGVTGQTYSNNTVFQCDGNGALQWDGRAQWNGIVLNDIIPNADNTFTLGSNPSNAWASITVNNVNAGGALNPGGVAANDLVLNSLKIMPEYGFDVGGNGQDIGEFSASGGTGAGGFRQVFAREFIAGANGNATGTFKANASAGTSSATLSAFGPDLSLNNSIQANSVILSSNSNVISGGTNPALVFTNSSVQNMILYGNNTVTSGNRDKIFNIGYDSTLTNSPINGTSGYQMQFTLGGPGAGSLDVAGKGTFTGTVQAGNLSDSIAQITGGVGTGFTSITSTTLTDGAGATLNGGIVTGNTLTDSTLSIASGSITGGINGDIFRYFITNSYYKFTGHFPINRRRRRGYIFNSKKSVRCR